MLLKIVKCCCSNNCLCYTCYTLPGLRLQNRRIIHSIMMLKPRLFSERIHATFVINSLKKKKQQTPHIMFVFCSNKRAVMLMANMRLSFFFSLRCYTDVQLNIDSFFHCCSIACLGATICIEQYSDTVTSSYYSAISGEYVCNMSKKLYVVYTLMETKNSFGQYHV